MLVRTFTEYKASDPRHLHIFFHVWSKFLLTKKKKKLMLQARCDSAPGHNKLSLFPRPAWTPLFTAHQSNEVSLVKQRIAAHMYTHCRTHQHIHEQHWRTMWTRCTGWSKPITSLYTYIYQLFSQQCARIVNASSSSLQ